MLQLITIFLALLLGYALKSLPISERLLDHLLVLSISLILGLMGYSFGAEAQTLWVELMMLGKLVGAFVVLLLGFNVGALWLLLPSATTRAARRQACWKSYLWDIMLSMKYVLVVVAGMWAGYIIKVPVVHLSGLIDIVLWVALFIVGHQLRRQNIPLKKILLNKIGLQTAGIVVVSSFLAGFMGAWVLHLPVKVGLVLVSGYGWYSLSGILTGQVLNHQLGTAAFFIDFLREIVALIIIPLLGKRHAFAVIGYSGATALDFTLPMLKLNLGEDKVSIATTSGMILTLLSPLLIPLLAGL